MAEVSDLGCRRGRPRRHPRRRLPDRTPVPRRGDGFRWRMSAQGHPRLRCSCDRARAPARWPPAGRGGRDQPRCPRARGRHGRRCAPAPSRPAGRRTRCRLQATLGRRTRLSCAPRRGQAERQGAHVRVYDPQANLNARAVPPALRYVAKRRAALRRRRPGAPPDGLARVRRDRPCLGCRAGAQPQIIDGRNKLDAERRRAPAGASAASVAERDCSVTGPPGAGAGMSGSAWGDGCCWRPGAAVTRRLRAGGPMAAVGGRPRVRAD